MKQLVLFLFVPFFGNGQELDCLLTSHTSIANDTEEFAIIRTYTDNGELISRIETRALNGGSYTVEERYIYNEKGFLSEIETYQNGELAFKRELTYNNLGKLVSELDTRAGQTNPIHRISILSNENEKLFYNLDGSVSGREVIRNNERGQETLKELRGKDNELFHATSTTYTESGENLYQENIDVVGDITEEKYWEYDKAGNLLKDSTFVNQELQSKTLYEYNAAGGLIKKVRKNSFGEIEHEVAYKLNENLLPVEEAIYFSGKLSSTKKSFYRGLLKVKEEQFNALGDLQRVITWEYKCN